MTDIASDKKGGKKSSKETAQRKPGKGKKRKSETGYSKEI